MPLNDVVNAQAPDFVTLKNNHTGVIFHATVNNAGRVVNSATK